MPPASSGTARALIMTGESGAGKSTLAALLGERGWRLMGDEFALIDLDDGTIHPFPRAVSLKNGDRGDGANRPEARFGPAGTRPRATSAICVHATTMRRWGGGDAGLAPVPALRRTDRRPAGRRRRGLRAPDPGLDQLCHPRRTGVDALSRFVATVPAKRQSTIPTAMRRSSAGRATVGLSWDERDPIGRGVRDPDDGRRAG